MTDNTSSAAGSVSPCGTYAGWNQHMRKHTPICGPCRKARTDYQRAYRAAGRDPWVNRVMGTAVRGTGWPRADNSYSVKLDQDSE